jgi:hypothetical protein
MRIETQSPSATGCCAISHAEQWIVSDAGVFLKYYAFAE